MKRRRVLQLVLATACLAASVSHAAAQEGELRQGFRLALGADYRGGPVEGHWQTPTGGEPGTTSPDRPELEEFGIDWINAPRLWVSAGLDRHALYFQAQPIDLHGSGVLDVTLVSQGQIFPAGTLVRANLDLDWYRAGYTYTQPLAFGDDGRPHLLLWASAGAIMLSSDFELIGENGAAAHRSYNKIGPQLGAGASWRVTDQISFVGDLTMSLPFSDQPFVISAEMVARYELFKNDRGQSGRLKLGVASETVEFDDKNKQVEPNEINIDIGPLLVFGFELSL